jgi:hypothetical protein
MTPVRLLSSWPSWLLILFVSVSFRCNLYARTSTAEAFQHHASVRIPFSHGRAFKDHKPVPSNNAQSAQKMSSISQKQYCSGKKSALAMSKREGEGEGQSDENEGVPPSTTAKPPALVNVLRLVFSAVSQVYSFGFIFVGVFAMCGLTLDLLGYGLGYGYHLSNDDGLVIDTLENLRMKAQFQIEISQSMKEATLS